MDIVALANQVMPYITAAVGAYGGAVLTKAQDLAADESVNLGRRLLQRFLSREESRERIESAVQDVVETPDDEDLHAALRGQLKKALAADPGLAGDVAELLRTAPAAAIAANVGSQIVSGSSISGDNIQIGQARDVDIRRH
ncbi:hypothetical protein HCN51_25800 [Nonomuraea sp. FMUSA5-5]|uniref:Uncharacterized protein n=1 Tax=Nonomuraea composti TaxID=2720023 RepID=A0ABX1B5U4_9ACTN|nr:hypothetical protein [Nonomuraea sp. FMUSA5-5]NJP92831.1 hypothetical protein [Nonomuraea sp. FMUSA5-5]